MPHISDLFGLSNKFEKSVAIRKRGQYSFKIRHMAHPSESRRRKASSLPSERITIVGPPDLAIGSVCAFLRGIPLLCALHVDFVSRKWGVWCIRRIFPIRAKHTLPRSA